MAKRSNIPLDDDDDVLAQKIEATAREAGIPSLTPQPAAPEEAQRATPRAPATDAPRRPIKLEVSAELFDALTIAAAQRRVTKRFLILETLRDAGFPVEDADLAEDGRRLRGIRSN